MTTRIVVIGGGYGGMMAALRAAGKNRDAVVTLVSAEAAFVERIRLHEYAANRPLKRRAIAEMLRGTPVQFVQGWVTGLDVDSREIVVDKHQRIAYDYLVYALGSTVDQTTVPGIGEYAEMLDPHGGADALRDQLQRLAGSGARVVVVGGGATGIESATEIRALNPALQVELITDGVFGAFKGKRVEQHLRQAFRAQGIEICEGLRVCEVRAGELALHNGTRIPFDLCLWAGGFSAPLLAREAGVAVNERNQLLLDPYGRSVSHPEIYGVGDAGQPLHRPGAPYRMSVFVALVMGALAADNITVARVGRAPQSFSFLTYGQAVSLGPRDAVFFMTYPDDRAVGPILRGRLAVNLRRFFVTLQVLFLGFERRAPGSFSWQGRNRYKIDLAAPYAEPLVSGSRPDEA